MIESLQNFQKYKHTGVTHQDARKRRNGQVAVHVFPKTVMDRLCFLGFSAEVWLQKDQTLKSWPKTTASVYRTPPQEGSVALVLGAGNQPSIGILDALHKLYMEAQVCILKFNPVNEYLAPFYAKMLDPLIKKGFVRLCLGGTEAGKYLCQHDLIDEIHITGSAFTHDAIVYGVGEEGQKRKEADDPICNKRISSELGNLTPIVVVPGNWNKRELKYHAENVVTQLTNNAGFNCATARVLITNKEWPQEQEFLDLIKGFLAQVPTRPAYYPGAHDRFDRFMNSAPSCEGFGEIQDNHLPWGFATHLDAQDTEHVCFTQEAFCGFFAHTSLDASDAGDFLDKAVHFANERLWGTLSACVIIDPRTEKAFSLKLETALTNLRYGSICINHWSAISYGLGSTTWGAYPGHTRQDIQSGVGVVHNSYFLEHVEKSVIRGPFFSWPKPPWFVTHQNSYAIGQTLTHMAPKPSLLGLPKVLWYAVQG
jgi:hypothetical protein